MRYALSATPSNLPGSHVLVCKCCFTHKLTFLPLANHKFT